MIWIRGWWLCTSLALVSLASCTNSDNATRKLQGVSFVHKGSIYETLEGNTLGRLNEYRVKYDGACRLGLISSRSLEGIKAHRAIPVGRGFIAVDGPYGPKSVTLFDSVHESDTLAQTEDFFDLSYFPDYRQLAIVKSTGEFHGYLEVQSYHCSPDMKFVPGPVFAPDYSHGKWYLPTSVSFSPTHNWIAMVSGEGIPAIWKVTPTGFDPIDLSNLDLTPLGNAIFRCSVSVSPDLNHVVVTMAESIADRVDVADFQLVVWNRTVGEVIFNHRWRCGCWICPVTFLANDKMVCSDEKNLHVIRVDLDGRCQLETQNSNKGRWAPWRIFAVDENSALVSDGQKRAYLEWVD